jgi:superfamily II DNA or RNA helicase
VALTVNADIDIDLAEIEEAVGETAFKRGRAYARKSRVLSLEWDPQELELSGRVMGSGAIYETSATFASDDEDGWEFVDGECSCPIGWNCKHVAALAVTASTSAGSTSGRGHARAARTPGDAQLDASDAGAGGREPTTASAGSRGQVESSWERPLRLMLGTPELSATGAPLAIELAIADTSSPSSARAPRLQARLMRPGARGGWANGSLRWGSLESWNLRGAEYREDHLALARDFYRAHQTQIAASQRYWYYGSGDRDTKVDLTDWDASQLWPLLDRAARLGMVCVHAHSAAVEVGRYQGGELSLDVTRQDDGGGAVIRPRIAVERPEEVRGLVPLVFLGLGGHGLVLVEPTTELSKGRLRLIRLARDTPAELQSMVLEGRGMGIPAHDLPRFKNQLAPALRHVAPVTSSDASFAVPEVSAPTLVLAVAYGEGHSAQLDWRWRYGVGDETLEFPLDRAEPGIRDVEAEQAALEELLASGPGLAELATLGALGPGGRPRVEPTVLGGLDTAALTQAALPALEGAAALSIEVTGEPADYRDVDDALEVNVATRDIDGDRDWFDLDVTIGIEGHELAFAEVFAALARGESRILLADGAHFSLLSPQLKSLRELIEEARALGDGGRPGRLRISRYQSGLWRDLVGLGVASQQSKVWQRQVAALERLEDLEVRPAPPGLDAVLRPYQLEGFNWLATMWELGLGGILADDMGLGKTLQALAMICHALAAGEQRPFLVLAPTSVVGNWVSEAERFVPGLAVQAMTDTLARAGLEVGTVAESADVVVTTYTLARLDAERYGTVSWAGVLLDEAQAVKNHHSKTHAAVRRLNAPFKLAITGTPMENHLGELWALLSITAPGLFPDPEAFDRHFGRPIQRAGDAERLATLRARIRPLVKRRTKELVASDLPAKQEQLLEVELHPRHRKVYDRQLQRERQRILGLLDDFDTNRFSILTGITRLRQLSLHPALVDPKDAKVPAAKLDALSEQLAEVAAGGHRALVFSQFTGFLALVRQRLDTDAIPYCYLDGSTRQRPKVVDTFRRGDAPVFLISLKAGGAGLNLVEADYCFLLDPWWNPAVENQAIDRAHRIGQTRQVMVYRMIAQNTIEEKVIALAQRKAALFAGVMDEGQLFSGQISAEDIRGLLS